MRYRIQIHDGQLQIDMTVKLAEIESMRTALKYCGNILELLNRPEITPVSRMEGDDDVILTSAIGRTRG